MTRKSSAGTEPTVRVYDLSGKIVGEERLNAKIFAVPENRELLHDVVRAQQLNSRASVAHTKTRGDVSGGGRKPWKQKGTGRARHGSIRSPIWKGGGVTFGPRSNRNFDRKVNRQAKRKALFMALSGKVSSGQLVILDRLEVPEAKTKHFAALLRRLPVKRTVLTVLPGRDDSTVRSSRNLPDADTIRADSLNVVDVLSHDSLLMPKASLSVIERVFLRG